jgi:hypothetical protein
LVDVPAFGLEPFLSRKMYLLQYLNQLRRSVASLRVICPNCVKKKPRLLQKSPPRQLPHLDTSPSGG